MHQDIKGLLVSQEGRMNDMLQEINRISGQRRPVDSLQPEQTLNDEADNLSTHLGEIAKSVPGTFSPQNTGPSSEASVPPSVPGSSHGDPPPSPGNLPNITHVEPLQELAQRFKLQAEHDWEHHRYKDAEFHHLEAIKCFKELHDAHGVSFDDSNNMNMTLSMIYKKLKKYEDAKLIVQLSPTQPMMYDGELGRKKMLLDAAENTEHRAQFSHAMAELHLDEFQTSRSLSRPSVDMDGRKPDEVLLREAELHAKRAFRIRRNLHEKDHPSCKESARLLVDIYSNYTDKRIYVETYTDMYLASNTSIGTTSPRPSHDLAELIKDHAITPEDVVGSATSTDLKHVTDRKPALMVAMDCANFDNCHRCNIIVDKLIRLGADRNAPFAHAVKKDRIAGCKLLRRRGADMNWVDASGFTPLMHAVKQGNLEMISYLLTEQLEINTRGYKGQTVLHVAAQTRIDDVFKLLLQTDGLEIDATDDNGMTAMHYAAKHDNRPFAKRLGRAKANLEIKDKSISRRTPLYIAIKEDKYSFAKVLLKYGAEVDLGYLPRIRSSDISNLLRNHQRPDWLETNTSATRNSARSHQSQVVSEHLEEVVAGINSACISGESDAVAITEAVSSITRTNSNWEDGSSMHEPLSVARQLDTSNAATTYSLDSSTDGSSTDYLRAFAEKLAEDLKTGFSSTKLSDVPPTYMTEALRMFTWKLHEESKDPFQWGVSVALNQKREYVMPCHHVQFYYWKYYSGRRTAIMRTTGL
jgi:hypothetical protein